MFHEVTFTREDLYRKVWEKPVLQLAKEIGVSDVGLGKACRKALIPLPGRGYWAMPEVRRPKKPSLPAAPKGYLGAIRFLVMDAVPNADPAPQPTVEVAPISVPSELTSPHALVKQAKKTLQGLKPLEGRLVAPKSEVLDIGVSPHQIDRVLRMLDALIKACEEKGWRWKIADEGTLIQCNGEQIRIRVWEVLSKSTISAEQRNSRKLSNYSNYERYEWVSSGRVSVVIESGVANGARRNWASTPNSPVEDKLHEIVAGLPLVAEGMRLQREQREAWKRNWDEEEARRKEAARNSEIQRRLRARLVGSLESWERADRLQRFCEAARERAKLLEGDERERADSWIAWALARACELDPLGQRLKATTSLHVELESWYSGTYQQPPEDWWSKIPK